MDFMIDDDFNILDADGSIKMAVVIVESTGLPESFEQFRHGVMERAQQLRATLEGPDDDWPPLLDIQSPDGSVAVCHLGGYMENDEEKDKAAAIIIPGMLVMRHALQAALIHTAWMATGKPGDGQPMRASEHPDRKEVVFVTMADGEHWEMWCAPIKRFRTQPPSLLPFKEFARKGGPMNVSGRMVDSMLQTLQMLNNA